jgi:hypothetical protein
MYIECTNGTPVVDTLGHLPPLPLHIDYRSKTSHGVAILSEQDEAGIHHALQLHDRVHQIYLDLPPSFLQKCLGLMDTSFPMLENLWFRADEIATLTLPKAFLAPNLHRLYLPGIGLPRRLRLVTSTVSLVTLVLWDIQASSYFRPRLLVARLSSLPHLKELSIGFAVPIPRPSAERELLGEKGIPVTLPKLKSLWFRGLSPYLESLVAQIRAPLLKRLRITLFNQISFALPHLHYLINTEIFTAAVSFDHNYVSITTDYQRRRQYHEPLHLRVMCKQLDWQIDCAAQICSALFPALSVVTQLKLDFYDKTLPTEWQNGGIDSTTWHDLLRSFIGVEFLHIGDGLLAELSRALQTDEIGSDPGFLPDLRYIGASDNLFASFIDTRRVVGRPIRFLARWPFI